MQWSVDNWFAAKRGRVSWANSKVSSAKIINHSADKDCRCWQARIGFTRHAASTMLILWWERKRLCRKSKEGGSGCHLEYVRLMIGYLTQKGWEEERWYRENRRYQSGKVTGHTWSAPRRQDVSPFSLSLSLSLSLSFSSFSLSKHGRLRHCAANWLPIGRW